MSSSRKRRVTKRRGTEGLPAGQLRKRTYSPRGEELIAAERRAVAGKRVLAASGACIFAAAMVFARHSYAGHPKQQATALTASPRFVKIVRRNLLQAGVVAPAEAPSGATTAVS